jgi:pyruvate ferredoxin oxidoreductase beta subunit
MVSPTIVDGAVESCFWPLFEVENGQWRLTYRPAEKRPVEEWLRSQKRFAHLFTPGGSDILEEIQRRVDADWDRLVEKCGG